MMNFLGKKGVVLLALLMVPACFAGTLKDKRDGKTYKTVKIGNQEWMAENLNFDYNHGSAKSFCYKNKSKNCEKYGRLYTWSAAMDSAAIYSKDGVNCGNDYGCDAVGKVRGVCSEGWHLPSKEEFEELLKVAGGHQDEKIEWLWADIGVALKSKTGWGDGTDALGFAALPAGYYVFAKRPFGLSPSEHFDMEGVITDFWSSTKEKYTSTHAYTLNLISGRKRAALEGVPIENSTSHSVRCVKD